MLYSLSKKKGSALVAAAFLINYMSAVATEKTSMFISISIQNGFPKSAFIFCKCSIELKNGLFICEQDEKV